MITSQDLFWLILSAVMAIQSLGLIAAGMASRSRLGRTAVAAVAAGSLLATLEIGLSFPGRFEGPVLLLLAAVTGSVYIIGGVNPARVRASSVLIVYVMFLGIIILASMWAASGADQNPEAAARLVFQAQQVWHGRWLAWIACSWMLGPGGNYVVRALLDMGHVGMPPPQTDADEAKGPYTLRAGRIIGVLERVMVAAFVTAGSFEAVGFLIAAKGLVRLKQAQDQNLAEYFLVGTLGSLAVGLAVALLIQTRW